MNIIKTPAYLKKLAQFNEGFSEDATKQWNIDDQFAQDSVQMGHESQDTYDIARAISIRLKALHARNPIQTRQGDYDYKGRADDPLYISKIIDRFNPDAPITAENISQGLLDEAIMEALHEAADSEHHYESGEGKRYD